MGSVLSPGETVHELYVRVHSDPSHPERQLRTAHVLLGNGAPFDSYLTPDDADQAADELAAFAAKIREAARTARLANTASGDSDPDMDEALRRVRGGAA